MSIPHMPHSYLCSTVFRTGMGGSKLFYICDGGNHDSSKLALSFIKETQKKNSVKEKEDG